MKFKINILALLLAVTGINTSCTNHRSLFTPARSEIVKSMQNVADWQTGHFSYSTEKNLHDYGIDSWTNGTLYIGLLELAKIAGDNSVYMNWLEKIGAVTEWKIPANFGNNPRYKYYHADELCIGQFYLGMYDLKKDPSIYLSTKERADWIMNNPGDTTLHPRNKQLWTWCDALFMAPSVYAHLYLIENSEKYISFMDFEFKRTYHYLYDKEYGLFFRDGSYFEKREQNGEKIFWGRGNGWVAAGLVQILKLLPANSTYRPFYEELFQEFVPRIASLQNAEGFWHASLLDTVNYPSPEISATALITYAIAYGINEGLLSEKEYTSKALNGWKALNKAIDENGKLGWVQPIGADPKKVTADMTASYGIGAFLLAGSELYRLVRK